MGRQLTLSTLSGTKRTEEFNLKNRPGADLREHLAPFYSQTGRPSVDPELMIRMLIIGYCLGIRSERRLCEEVKLNLAYRWRCNQPRP
jgi:transposase